MARYIAKNIVKAGLADSCEVQLAYAIGVAEPVSVYIKTTNCVYTDDVMTRAVKQVFDMRPKSIIQELGLSRPIYRKLAAYGHIGREELGVKWEICDKTDALIEALKHV